MYTATSGTTTNLATGVETSIFMIPNGAAVAGQRAGLTNAAGNANFTTPNNGSGTAATIALAATLPDVTGPATAIDGNTQTRSTGDSNAPVTTQGSESTGPEVLVNLNGKAGLTIQAANDQVLALGLYNSINSGQGLYIGASAVSAVVQNSTISGNGANITFQGASASAPSAATITGNIIRDSQRGTADGIELNGNNSNMTISNNQFLRNAAMGIDFIAGANTGNTITNNIFAYNGALPGNSQQSGIAFRSGGSNNNLVQGNTFLNNSGPGIVARAGTTGNRFLQNSFSGNGYNPYTQSGTPYTAPAGLGLAIDLTAPEPSGAANSYNLGDGVTLNDNGDTDGGTNGSSGANGLINFPIIQSAIINANGTVTVAGFARPNVTVELYLAADDPTHFGEGQTFVTSFQQGNAAGTVNGVTTGIAGTYGPGTLNDGLAQGTDNTLAYSYTFTPTAAQLTALRQSTALLTSTSTLGTADNGNFGTSEFSGNARIFQAPVPNDATNVAVASNTTVPVTLSPSLSATAYGLTANVTTSTTNTVNYYTVSLPSSGTLYYNGTALTSANVATTQVSDLSQLKFVPQYGSTNPVTFTYTATDANGLTSTQHSTGGTISNGAAIYTIPVTTSADVTASITGSTILASGQPTGYYVATYTNVGPATASGVAQTVTLPAGATLTTAQRNAITTAYPNATFGTATGGATTITFTPTAGVTLNSGDANSYRFVFTAPTAAGSSSIAASVSTTTSEGTNAAPNTATLALTTNAPTDVQALLSASAATVTPGSTANFTATFQNNTAQPAAGVVATVQLPVGLTPTTVTGQTGTTSGTTVTYGTAASLNTTTGLLTYTLNSLAANAQQQSVIAFTMPTTSSVAATAGITTTTAESNTTNNVAPASIAPAAYFDLATTLTGPTSATAGSPVTLYVTTSNNGPQAISGAVQTVTIPANLNAAGSPNVFISNGGTYNNSTGVVTFPALGSLPAGQMVGNTITFNAPTTSSFPLSASVTPTDTGGDTAPANNTAYLNGATSNTNVTVNAASGATANVYATLTANAQIVAGGTQVTYTAGIGNSGPGTATNVVSRLQLIPNLSVATLLINNQTGTPSTDGKTITYPNGATYTIATGVIASANTAALPSGTTVYTSTATVTVPANVGNDGQLLAVMSVSSQSPDNVPADNVKSVVVTVQPQADLATTISGPTGGVVTGQTVSYSALFTNNGPTTARTVAQTIQLPAGLTAAGLQLNGATGTGTTTITFGSGTTAATYNATTGLLTLPALTTDAVGATQLFTVSFPAPTQSFVVSSAIGSGTADGVLTNNAASVATAVTPTADVAVTVAGPATAVAGNQITYAVTTTNNGPVAATGVAPTLLLPANLSGVTVSGGSYDGTTGLVTFTALSSLAPGTSSVSYVTLPMPTAPTGGSISPLASVTTTSYDNAAANNAAGITTSVAPGPGTSADLIATITPPASVTAGASTSFTFNFQNNSTSANAAAFVRPVANLPTGLTAGNLIVSGGGGTLSNGQVTFSNGATYDPATGTLTFPTTASLAVGSTVGYSVSFPAPGSSSLTVTSEVTANTTDPVSTNNAANATVTVNPSFDLTTAIVGPAAALAGQQNVYTVTTTSSGLSTAGPVTQTATLPKSQTTSTLLVNGKTGTLNSGNGIITYPDNSTYDQNSGLLTFPSIGSLTPGAANAVTNSFTLTMPNVASLNIPVNVSTTASGETNGGNNTNSTTTTKSPLTFAPVAENIVNALQNVRGSTSNTNLLISPLYATDPDGSIAATNGYSILTLPTSGTLFYNGTALPSTLPSGGFLLTNPALLSYQPAGGFVGNTFFTYAAIDNNGAVSNTALYTIPVAQDLNTTYTTYNTGKGNANPYTTGDILATTQDPNTDVFNNAGLIYNATTGALQTGAANGVGSASYTGTLPNGVTFATTATSIVVNGTTVQIPAGTVYVSNASLLPRVTTATSYPINVTTTDLNGGINTVQVTIILGQYPLPVELVAFTAQAVQNRDGLLKWTTASELNNNHFDVERSLDGTSFTKLGEVAGQGNKASATDYSFTDAGIGPKVAAGQPVYYRLKQVDTDGTSTYSPVRTVSFTGTTVVTVSLYPNPATTATGLDLSALPATGTYQVLLLDATGRAVRTATLAGGLLQPLDLHDLSAGTYQVLVTGQQANGSALKQVLRLIKE